MTQPQQPEQPGPPGPPEVFWDLEEMDRRLCLQLATLQRERLKPLPTLTVSEWADSHRMLPGTSAEPGRWRTDRTPYLREIMDSFSDPLVEVVVFKKAAQIGGSEALLNVLGYFIDQDPAPILFVQVSDGEAAKFSKERVAPMISDCPVLASKVREPRSRDSGNTIEAKVFPGGHLGIVGANAPSKLRARPRRVVLFDEVDGYPPSAGTEGDPIELGVKRTTTYWNRKIGKISTPTIAGLSRIDQAFEESDQRKYLIPCPHCDHYQELIWDRVRWDKEKTSEGEKHRPETAVYVCAECERPIKERLKTRMLERGRWKAMKPESSVRGYQLSALYSPWFTWADLAREFLAAKAFPERLRVFVNTRLAETFKERGDAPAWQRVYDRRESYPIGTCPAGVLFVTVGVDVQKDRIEMFVWGWGRDKESWYIDDIVAEGDPYNIETWVPVTECLHRTFPTADGQQLPVARLAIDTGFAQETVIDWARRVADRRVMLIKGDHWKNWTVIVGAPSKSEVTYKGRRTGLLLFPVGGALIKQETYGFLRLDRPVDGQPFPPGYIHIPMITDERIKQLCAEDLVTRQDRRGFVMREWVKNRHRNEALDGRVYARAAAEQLGLGRYVTAPEPPPSTPQPPTPPSPDPRTGQPKKGWLDRGRGRGGGWLGR